MIFAREVSDPLTSLVKKIDEATAKNASAKLGSFIVFLSDDEKLEKALKDWGTKNKIEHTILTIDNPAGPQGYGVAKDADVTVVLYSKHNVKVNYAFRRGELSDKDADKIVADLPKILAEKKPEKKKDDTKTDAAQSDK
jgi:hypothetical protein